GEKFADALSGSVLAAKQNEPIVLVKETKVPESTRDLLRSKDYGHFTLLGGTGAVSSKAVRYVLNPSLYPRERLAGEIIDDARSLLGVPYSWGGTSPSGFDCSGFVNYVMDRKNGISLPRTSRGMWSATNDHRVSNLKTGDLVFFNTSGSGISHVGIYIGDGQFISATSDGVSIAPVHGKWYWGDRYVGATRVF
ncbi:MAG TPA: NlpC/P60 family protein, partial [Bacillales bacterium]|nr:NlpC/P60 family protein [Bacillales bacterium]